MDKLSLILLGLSLIIFLFIYFKLRSIDRGIDKMREYIFAYMQRGSREEDIHRTLKRIEDVLSKS